MSHFSQMTSLLSYITLLKIVNSDSMSSYSQRFVGETEPTNDRNKVIIKKEGDRKHLVISIKVWYIVLGCCVLPCLYREVSILHISYYGTGFLNCGRNWTNEQVTRKTRIKKRRGTGRKKKGVVLIRQRLLGMFLSWLLQVNMQNQHVSTLATSQT